MEALVGVFLWREACIHTSQEERAEKREKESSLIESLVRGWYILFPFAFSPLILSFSLSFFSISLTWCSAVLGKLSPLIKLARLLRLSIPICLMGDKCLLDISLATTPVNHMAREGLGLKHYSLKPSPPHLLCLCVPWDIAQGSIWRVLQTTLTPFPWPKLAACADSLWSHHTKSRIEKLIIDG